MSNLLMLSRIFLIFFISNFLADSWNKNWFKLGKGRLKAFKTKMVSNYWAKFIFIGFFQLWVVRVQNMLKSSPIILELFSSLKSLNLRENNFLHLWIIKLKFGKIDHSIGRRNQNYLGHIDKWKYKDYSWVH